jgi:thioredoxin 1
MDGSKILRSGTEHVNTAQAIREKEACTDCLPPSFQWITGTRGGKKILTPIPELTCDELQKIIDESKKPVIVEFFTRSCIPCTRIGPLLLEIRRDFANELTVVKVDIEEHPAVAAKHDVAAVPTLLVFIKGLIWLRIVGLVAKKDLLRVVQESLLAIKKS